MFIFVLNLTWERRKISWGAHNSQCIIWYDEKRGVLSSSVPSPTWTQRTYFPVTHLSSISPSTVSTGFSCVSAHVLSLSSKSARLRPNAPYNSNRLSNYSPASLPRSQGTFAQKKKWKEGAGHTPSLLCPLE